MKNFTFPAGPRLLPLLAVVGAGALALRLVGIAEFAGSAAAQQTAIAEPPRSILTVAPAAGPAPVAKADAPRTESEEGAFSPAEIELLQGLAQRRAAIEKQAEEIARREALLKAAEQSIDKKLAELKSLQASVEASLRRNDDEEQTRKKSLVRIFESMKAPEAARIFEQMEIAQLVDLVERMKERSVAPILAQMHPVRARQVAAELAKRRQPAPPAG